MTRMEIRNGRALLGNGWVTSPVSIEISDGIGTIATATGQREADWIIDASDLLVLPGIVDLHGDAFERQLEPRPNVRVSLDVALLETDRQLIANGITTAYHGVTWSWEPGLRGADSARSIVAAIGRLASRLATDTRVHLRHETFNLEAEAEIIAWIETGRLGCIAFNDHMTGTIKDRHRPEKMNKMIERSGLAASAFAELVERTYSRRSEVPGSITRLAAAAKAADVPALSHDDRDAEQRLWFRERGVGISEFPTTESAAEAAIAAGELTVFGAPNVIRGGSHTGCPMAAEMAGKNLCSVLASDYYYPALLLSPFKLAADNIMPLERAWALVSENPARALGHGDRGVLTDGRRADLILVDASTPALPRVVATLVNGRIRFLTEPERIGDTRRT